MKTTQQTPNYLIELSDFLDKPIENLVNEIDKIEGIKLSDLKVRDLTYCNDKLIEPGLGVYIFKVNEPKEQILLVGKTSSNSFTERVPKHFDVRPGAWFNRLLFIVCREHYKIKISGKYYEKKDYEKASKFVFENGKLVLINAKDLNQINELENILRGTAEPLNKFKSKTYDKSKILSSVLK